MLRSSDWPLVCRQPSEVPDRCLKTAVKAEIAAALGRPLGEMFPAFAANFPLATEAMRTHWPTPVLVVSEFAGTTLAALVLEGSEQNVFFDLGNFAVPTSGDQFDSYVAMLPTAWKELYRWFWSFTITGDPMPAIYWRNTPTSYASRLRLLDWARMFKGSTARAKAFAQTVDSTELRGWLATDAGDSLWLDEQRGDHKVYHVRGGAFDEAAALRDPDGTLDRYLAHVLSDGSPAEFDFRA